MCTSDQSELKISVLFDNRRENPSLQEGWGLSLFIEHGDKKILFDTGGSLEKFVKNSEQLSIRPEAITHLIISHRHWDHRTGLTYVLERLNRTSKVYLPKFFCEPFLKMKYRTFSLKRGISFQEIEKDVFILTLNGGFLLYEQTLLFSTSNGVVVITGCAHPGIIKILQEVKDRFPRMPISCVVGGFHLYKAPFLHTREIVRSFQAHGVERVAPCHCSGVDIIQQFQEAYRGNFLKIGAGSVFRL